jgi:hypothetical protein
MIIIKFGDLNKIGSRFHMLGDIEYLLFSTNPFLADTFQRIRVWLPCWIVLHIELALCRDSEFLSIVVVKAEIASGWPLDFRVKLLGL